LYATLLQVDAVLAKPKAKMPDLTASIRRSKTAEEVAEHINSAWLTYGAGPVTGAAFELDKSEMPEAESNGQMDLFDGAMKYLWFKSKDKGDSRTYTMRGLGYAVVAVDDGEVITVSVEVDKS
jgi:hypothetical protein